MGGLWRQFLGARSSLRSVAGLADVFESPAVAM